MYTHIHTLVWTFQRILRFCGCGVYSLITCFLWTYEVKIMNTVTVMICTLPRAPFSGGVADAFKHTSAYRVLVIKYSQ